MDDTRKIRLMRKLAGMQNAMFAAAANAPPLNPQETAWRDAMLDQQGIPRQHASRVPTRVPEFAQIAPKAQPSWAARTADFAGKHKGKLALGAGAGLGALWLARRASQAAPDPYAVSPDGAPVDPAAAGGF